MKSDIVLPYIIFAMCIWEYISAILRYLIFIGIF